MTSRQLSFTQLNDVFGLNIVCLSFYLHAFFFYAKTPYRVNMWNRALVQRTVGGRRLLAPPSAFRKTFQPEERAREFETPAVVSVHGHFSDRFCKDTSPSLCLRQTRKARTFLGVLGLLEEEFKVSHIWTHHESRLLLFSPPQPACSALSGPVPLPEPHELPGKPNGCYGGKNIFASPYFPPHVT